MPLAISLGQFSVDINPWEIFICWGNSGVMGRTDYLSWCQAQGIDNRWCPSGACLKYSSTSHAR